MTDYDGPRTKAGLQEMLSIARDRDVVRVRLGDVDIGRIVSFGRTTNARSSARKTIYASRIQWNGLKVEVEGTSVASVVNKIAGELAAGLKNARSDEVEPTAPAMR